MKKYNNEKYIVSFTSFGNRFNNACKMIYALQKQSYKDFHLVMTVYKDDVKNITPDMKLLIDNNFLEVIIADINLKPHLKYFYAMKKYWDKPIITIDDDRIYQNNLIKDLVTKYESISYKSIISNIAPEMTKHGNKLNARTTWCQACNRLKPNKMSYIAMAEGFAGILYPPKCFNNLDNEIDNIKKCLLDDDLFLKVLEIKQNIPVTQSSFFETSTNRNGKDIEESQKYRLNSNIKDALNYRNKVTELFSNELLKGFLIKS